MPYWILVEQWQYYCGSLSDVIKAVDIDSIFCSLNISQHQNYVLEWLKKQWLHEQEWKEKKEAKKLQHDYSEEHMDQSVRREGSFLLVL